MLDKDVMEEISGEYNKLSDEEKARRAQSLQRLLDSELQRRQQQHKPAARQGGLLAFFKKLFS